MLDRTEQVPDFLDVLDELLAVLLPLVPVLGHHQLPAVAGLCRRRRRRLVLLPLVSLSSSSAASACITTQLVFVPRNIRTRITTTCKLNKLICI